MSDLYLRKCFENDIEDILELQSRVFEDLGDQQYLLRQNSRDTFLSCLKEPSITIGLYDGDSMVGITIMEVVAESKESLRNEIQSVDISNDAYMKLIMIRKQYYGQKYQLKMLRLIEKIAFSKGFDFLTVTVSPKNYHSKNNIVQYGYIFDHSALKYGGLERDVLYKRINIEEYISNLLLKAEQTLGKNISLSPEMLGIELKDCYKGTIDICTTGDILEYVDSENNTFYGLYIDNEERKQNIIFYSPIEQRVKKVDFSELIDGLKLKYIWINTSYGELHK